MQLDGVYTYLKEINNIIKMSASTALSGKHQLVHIKYSPSNLSSFVAAQIKVSEIFRPCRHHVSSVNYHKTHNYIVQMPSTA